MRSWWIMPRPPTAGRAELRPGSAGRAGRRSGSTAATTTSLRPRSARRTRASRRRSWPPSSQRAERKEAEMENMRERFAQVTTALLDEDPRLALVLAEITADAFGAARRRHPDRVINLGIREQLLVSVAGGLALAGLRPIAHTFASFLIERPFEQIKLDLNHQDVGAVLVSAGASFDYSAAGRTHQYPGDVALLSTLPGWTVQVPGHPDEAGTMLRAAGAASGRVYLRLSALANAAPLAGSGEGFTVLRRGTRATIVAVGPLADAVIEAASGMDVTVLYASTVRPFDRHTLRTTLGAPVVVLRSEE